MRIARAFAIAALLTLGTGALFAQAAPSAPPARPRAARTPHRTLGKDDCLSCHRQGANPRIAAVPATGHDYAPGSCLSCHRLAATMPTRSQHPFDAAHTRCQACHVAGNTVNAQVTPDSHANYTTTMCVMCHEPQGQGS